MGEPGKEVDRRAGGKKLPCFQTVCWEALWLTSPLLEIPLHLARRKKPCSPSSASTYGSVSMFLSHCLLLGGAPDRRLSGREMLALVSGNKPREIAAALQRPCMGSQAPLGLLVCDKCVCSGPTRKGGELTLYLSVLWLKKKKKKNSIVLEWEREFLAWK